MKNRSSFFITIILVLLCMVFCSLFYVLTNANASGEDNPANGPILLFLFTAPFWFPVVIIILKLIANATTPDPVKELTRPHKKAAQTEASNKRAAQSKAAHTTIPDQTASFRGIIGAEIAGNLTWSTSEGWLTLPKDELDKHGVIVGGSGSGKTISMLRIAYIAAKVYGYRIFYLDAKGDKDTAAMFIALMRKIGKKPRMFPRETYNGFKGDGNAILNRLMAVETFSEPYYKAVTKKALNLVCCVPAQAPRDSTELFKRFAALDNDTELTKTELRGVELRYAAFFDTLKGKINNGWSWEDTEAGYILLDGLSIKEEAASLGRFLVEDFAHYATTRKAAGVKDLLIIDEYSALSQSGTDTANLVERLRSYGCAVILSSQSYAGLGKPQDAERILDAANWLLIHRNAASERLTSRAGSEKRIQESYQFGQAGAGDPAGNLRLEDEPLIHPDEARRLETGEAIIIAHGRYTKAQIVKPLAISTEELNEALQWVNEAPVTPLPAAPPAIKKAPSTPVKPSSNAPELL